MISTAKFIDLQSIISVQHGDPHSILGMHEVTIDNSPALAVRVYVPQAEKVFVFDPNIPEKQYEAKKIHMDGFFEAVIKDRTKWFRYKLRFVSENSEWECYDAYSFKPFISELDIYLFNQGTHYDIYEKLGAHTMEIDGVKGTGFAVWAPNARRVSVIGDFNNWDGRRHAMRLIQMSGIWEIFIPGVCEMDKYKYEIMTINGAIINKADPYANFAELRPATASMVFDINKYKWNDSMWFESQALKDKYNRPINIYEVHLGSWDKKVPDDDNGFYSYTELSDRLINYVADMGYTHIELLPIEEHPFDGSWGYQLTGYYAPTSRYGTPDEFMAFVDKCHQRGIGVILDWVPAHFPKDAHGLARFDGTALYEHQDPRQGEHSEWGTLVFNYGRNEVKNFLIANALFWLKKYHLDGLRVDAVASMLYLDYARKEGEWIPNKYGGRDNLDAVEFLKHMNSIISKRFPNAYIIAEESTAWPDVTKSVDYGGLGFNLKWNMGWMNDFLEYFQKDPIYRKYHHNNLTFSTMYAFSENYVLVLSHDEVVHGKKSMLDKMPGELKDKFANLRAAYGFQFGHPGKKLLFMGGEFGQFIEWNEKRPLDWFLLEYEHHKKMQNYVRDLNHFYLDEGALWKKDFTGEGFEWIDADDRDRSIYSFIRKGSERGETLVFLFNLTPNRYENFKQGMPFEGRWNEIFNSDNLKYGGKGEMNPYPMYTQKSESHHREDSIYIGVVPPLSIIILKAF